MKYTTNAYLITCLTNMHVGSGGANYGVVDNLVQRDSINNMPIINSSSLKGALREFFKNEWGEGNSNLDYIFGPDSTRKEGVEDGAGNYKFFPADLLVLPVRSNKKPFYRATTKMLVGTINQKADAFSVTTFLNADYHNSDKDHPKIEVGDDVKLEDWMAVCDINFNVDNSTLGNNVAIFHEDNFKQLAKKLPVIARNQLKNGESQNLWYEEVVPRESKFIFFVSIPGVSDNKKGEFDKLDDAIVQIGANASIGYGYCRITKISKP